MSDAAPFPDNAWLTYREATQRWGLQMRKDQAEYICKDASDAAIAAARAEGVRAAMERSEEAFMDAVWSALKADANDLRKQQRILRAYRAAAEAQP